MPCFQPVLPSTPRACSLGTAALLVSDILLYVWTYVGGQMYRGHAWTRESRSGNIVVLLTSYRPHDNGLSSSSISSIACNVSSCDWSVEVSILAALVGLDAGVSDARRFTSAVPVVVDVGGAALVIPRVGVPAPLSVFLMRLDTPLRSLPPIPMHFSRCVANFAGCRSSPQCGQLKASTTVFCVLFPKTSYPAMSTNPRNCSFSGILSAGLRSRSLNARCISNTTECICSSTSPRSTSKVRIPMEVVPGDSFSLATILESSEIFAVRTSSAHDALSRSSPKAASWFWVVVSFNGAASTSADAMSPQDASHDIIAR
eukprot:m.59182 g.59182  ORF g.59182 m.59182 type:complete len:315 (+) comp15675_c0_seq4:2860-3804(+)